MPNLNNSFIRSLTKVEKKMAPHHLSKIIPIIKDEWPSIVGDNVANNSYWACQNGVLVIYTSHPMISMEIKSNLEQIIKTVGSITGYKVFHVKIKFSSD